MPFERARVPLVNVAIVGAGAIGLNAARTLIGRGVAVTLFEGSETPGGLAAGFSYAIDDAPISLERFYHHIFRSDRVAIQTIGEVGLADRLEWHRPVTATWYEGRAYRLDSPASLLAFTPLSPPARWRMGAGLALLKALPAPEGWSARGYVRAVLGARADEVVFGPLLEGKFGPHAGDVELSWFRARITDRTAELGYLRGGFQQLYDRLAQRCREGGATLRFGVRVEGIEGNAESATVRLADGERASFDAVLATVATPVCSKLLGDDTLARNAPDSLWADVLLLDLREPLTQNYWTNLVRPNCPFIVAVEQANLTGRDDYRGRYPTYFGAYRTDGEPRLAAGDEVLLGQLLPLLREMNPRFELDWIARHWRFRAPHAQPVVARGYRSRLPPHRLRERVYLANQFHIYPHDRGQNYALELGARVANEILVDRPDR